MTAPKPRVRREPAPVYGLLGPRWEWGIWLGLHRIGVMRDWDDAVVVANLVAYAQSREAS